MKKTSRRSLLRDRFVHVARLRRLLAAFTGAGDGDFDSLRIDIDGDTGTLLESDGEGNHAAVLWNAAGLVALEYVHDIPEAREDVTPERHLQGVPRQLADLAEAAASFGPRIATSGAWALGDEGGGDWRDMRMLEPHTCPPEEAVEMLSPLGPKASALVVRAERATRSGGTYTMTEADADAVFGKKAPDPAHVAKAVKELERAGVGATPLWLALRKGHFEIAEHLVRAGADVDRASQNGCHGAGKCVPLRVAAAFGHAGLVRLLLERGADVLRDEWFWGILRAVADGRQWLGSTGQVGSFADYAEVIRLLLDAGTPLPNPRACHVLSEMVAAGGAPELAERLVPPPDRMLPG
jgi:hypothetical protein